MKAFLGEQHNNPTPVQLEALKMAEGGRMQRRRIALTLAAAAPVAILCYFWASVHFGYHLGLGTANAHADQFDLAMATTSQLDSSLRQPVTVNAGPLVAVGIGAMITIAMAWLKLRFLWWPLHPMAFPLALSSTLQYLPPAIFATWLLRALLLRYGGYRAHRQVLPFFLGLLVGGATAEVLQRIVLDLLGLAVQTSAG